MRRCPRSVIAAASDFITTRAMTWKVMTAARSGLASSIWRWSSPASVAWIAQAAIHRHRLRSRIAVAIGGECSRWRANSRVGDGDGAPGDAIALAWSGKRRERALPSAHRTRAGRRREGRWRSGTGGHSLSSSPSLLVLSLWVLLPQSQRSSSSSSLADSLALRLAWRTSSRGSSSPGGGSREQQPPFDRLRRELNRTAQDICSSLD